MPRVFGHGAGGIQRRLVLPEPAAGMVGKDIVVGFGDSEKDRLIEQHLERAEAGVVQRGVAPARRGLRPHDRQEFLLPVDVAPLQAEALAGAHPAVVAEDQQDIRPPVLRLGLGDGEQPDLLLLVERPALALAGDLRHLELGAHPEPLVGVLQEQPQGGELVVEGLRLDPILFQAPVLVVADVGIVDLVQPRGLEERGQRPGRDAPRSRPVLSKRRLSGCRCRARSPARSSAS